MEETDRSGAGTEPQQHRLDDGPWRQYAVDALAAIVSSSDDAIYSKDKDALVTSWNSAAERLYGYTADEILGRPISILIPDDRKGEEIEILNRILAGEHVHHFVTQRRRKNGEIVDVSISVSPVHDGRGEIVEAAVIGRDMTQQKKLERAVEEERQQSVERARRHALDLNDEVVQGLAAAKLALENDEHERGLRTLEATLKRAQRIVSSLLDAGQGAIEPGDLRRNKAADI